MAGIGTAARNWKDEELIQQGIGTPAYHEPAGSIGTAAQNQGIGTPAYHEPAGSIGTAVQNQGIGTAATKQAQLAAPAMTAQNVKAPQQKTAPAMTSGNIAAPKSTAPVINPAQQYTPTAKQTQQKTAPAPLQANQNIKTMEGVTGATKQRMNELQGGYQPGAAAQQAMEQLQQIQASKPAGYNSPYAGQLSELLAGITGQKPFSYSINQDALFQSLSDYYQEQARQASMNAIGNAAGLTGGYGNSAAQAVGSQAYSQAILPLYDKAMDTARFAYDVYQGNQADRYNQLQALMNMDQNEYGRYRDTVGDWKDEREYYTGRYDTEEDRGYARYKDDLAYWTGLAEIENRDYRDEQERQEAIRQYNQDYERRVFENDRDYDRGVYESDRDYDRGVYESDRGYALDVDRFNRQAYESDRDYAMDVDRFNRAAYESDRDYDRGAYESDRDYALDVDRFNRGAYESDRDYALDVDRNNRADFESDRAFNRGVLESDRAYDRGVLESDRAYDRGVYESDRDYNLNQQELQERIRQFDESLNWDKMSADQKYAAEWVMQTLAMGKMPSDELLAAAGLSAEDAQQLIAKVSSGGSGGGKNVYYLDSKGNPYKKNADGSMTPIDPTTMKRGDELVEHADTPIGISNLVTGIQGITDNWKKLLGQ